MTHAILHAIVLSGKSRDVVYTVSVIQTQGSLDVRPQTQHLRNWLAFITRL